MNSLCIKTVCTPEELTELIRKKLLRQYGRDPDSANKAELYKATCLVVRDIMSELQLNTYVEGSAHQKKELYYLSMEFLPGTSLRNNVFNLGLSDVLKEAISKLGGSLDCLYSMDPDAGLGNGGLGRLASCYLDAIATQGMAGHGMSICYEYGIFKQKIEEGQQKELADDWLDLGEVWLRSREEETKEVHFGGKLKEDWNANGEMKLIHTDYTTVLAIPRDMLITGYDSPVINTLRLWESTSPVGIDMDLFAKGKYLQAMERKHMAEIISKILYPEDAHREGKSLRIMQQYFFISASMQTIVDKHLRTFPNLDNFSDGVAIHINDTHPTMAIPELMRIFIDEHGYPWDDAWRIVTSSVTYTNHTIMPEALEVWPEDLFAKLLPRLHSIVWEINRRLLDKLNATFPQDENIRNRMSIIHDEKLRMANLCVTAAHKVNGVSSLHSGIIRDQLFDGFSQMDPDKFTNVTNGIAYRRWLCQANPRLSALLDEMIGPGFRKDAGELVKLKEFQNDSAVLEKLEEIKLYNKGKLAKYIKEHNNIIVNPESIFDVQVKRIHEYKRQLLNLLHVIHLYNEICANPNGDFQPRTFLFAGKAAAGYYIAKQVIRLAYHLSEVINKDPIVKDRLKIVFLENYSVSQSEIIMPAAEVSEQISLAGKEASGTGNMKLMINGAVTLGTLDGANVEIHQAVGDDNIFLFGMNVGEVEALRNTGTYSPWSLYQNNTDINRVIGCISEKINNQNFSELLNYLTTGYNGGADPFFVLADFQSYKDAQQELARAYADRDRWNRMSLANIASAGVFSADRAVREYAERIWNIRPL
ncbi:MAG: glycogen/starch/alpha-glucan phosphorylase [Anaerovoracaceae bacterium]